MAIQDRVDLFLGTLGDEQREHGSPGEHQSRREGMTTHKVDHSVQVLEATLLEHARVHVIFKVAIVERQTNAVQLQAGEEFGILLGEMILEPFVKEVFVVLLAKHAQHGLAVLALVAGIAGDEVFHAGCPVVSIWWPNVPIWWLKHIGIQG